MAFPNIERYSIRTRSQKRQLLFLLQLIYDKQLSRRLRFSKRFNAIAAYFQNLFLNQHSGNSVV